MNVLLVDDEPTIRATLGDALEDCGHILTVAQDFSNGMRALEHRKFDCVISDLRLPDGSGLDLIAKAREKHGDTSLLIITAHQTIETAIEATRQGAEYLIKPFLNEEVIARLAKIEEMQHLKDEVRRLKTQVFRRNHMDQLVGQSDRMQELFDTIRTIAPSDATVLISGESGTGKELVAQAIHRESPRAEKKLVKVSCAALPDSLLEDELFGHEKGAFTDARERKPGRFEMAHGGTIFLDDIDDMPLATQVKLLRVIQEREFERIGGTQTIKLDLRVIVATKVDLSLLVRDGRFRDDLFFRLNVVELRLPGLRERLDDLPILVEHFCNIHGKGKSYDVEPLALDAMGQYTWPGNVRELEHAVMRAIAMAGKSNKLDGKYLLQKPAAMHLSNSAVTRPLTGGTLLSTGPILTPAPQPRPAPDPPAIVSPQDVRPLREIVMEAERGYIRRILEWTGGNRTKTAQLLGISRKNLWEKMKELELK